MRIHGSRRPWILALLVLLSGCYFLQPALEMLFRLQAGLPIQQGPTTWSYAWWLPALMLLVAGLSVIVAYAIWRRWRHSWMYLAAFWFTLSALLAILAVAQQLHFGTRGILVLIVFVAGMAITTVGLRRHESGDAL
jgi:uncharacterized membrane protein YoaK (UPF0700 family)